VTTDECVLGLVFKCNSDQIEGYSQIAVIANFISSIQNVVKLFWHRLGLLCFILWNDMKWFSIVPFTFKAAILKTNQGLALKRCNRLPCPVWLLDYNSSGSHYKINNHTLMPMLGYFLKWLMQLDLNLFFNLIFSQVTGQGSKQSSLSSDCTVISWFTCTVHAL
jgi:hypothetical protein